MILKILDPLFRGVGVMSKWCNGPLKRQLISSTTNVASSKCRLFPSEHSGYCAISSLLNHRYRIGNQFPQEHPYWHIHSISFSSERSKKINSNNESKTDKQSELYRNSEAQSSSRGGSETPEDGKIENVSIFKRFKEMYRDYWYVLVPVHVITSVGWFGGFYYLAKSGVDIVALLESMGTSEKILNSLRDSSAGYLAVSYALYKIATPLRYMITIGGTTLSIKYLKEYGYIKPMPSRAKLREMYHERKENLIEKHHNFTDGIKQKTEKWKESREKFIKEHRESEISQKLGRSRKARNGKRAEEKDV